MTIHQLEKGSQPRRPTPQWFAEPWKRPASSSSTKTAEAPGCGFGSRARNLRAQTPRTVGCRRTTPRFLHNLPRPPTLPNCSSSRLSWRRWDRIDGYPKLPGKPVPLAPSVAPSRRGDHLGVSFFSAAEKDISRERSQVADEPSCDQSSPKSSFDTAKCCAENNVKDVRRPPSSASSPRRGSSISGPRIER